MIRYRIHGAPGTSTRPDWRDKALCATHHDLDLWHPDGNGARYTQQIDEAKAICRMCPVMAACQQWALDRPEERGVWGALDEDDRRHIWHRRRTNRTAA